MKKYLEKIKKLLPFCWIMILAACLTIGGTLAFLQEKTDPVTNTFAAGKITYELNLEANAKYINSILARDEYIDAEVSMPEVENIDSTSALSVEWSLEDPSLTGYIFSGWYYDEQCEIPYLYASNGKIVVRYGDVYDRNAAANAVEITLYAKWTPISYEIAYDGNNSTIGSMEKSQHTYDVAKDLKENSYSRTGYTFEGWNTQSDGSGTSYTNKEEVKNLTSTQDSTVTLYAQWEPITYTVKYHNNVDSNDTSVTQPTGSTNDSSHTYDVPKNLTTNGFTRTGYTFIGWNTQPDGKGDSYSNGEQVKNLTSVDNGTVNLYAQWGVKSYVIRYHANGGEGSMADQTIKYDVPTNLTACTFTKKDYSLGGWALSENGEIKYIDKQTVVNVLESGTLDLYAVWIQDSHTLTFDYNGGTGSPGSKQVQNGKAYGTLPEYPVHPTEEVEDNKIMTYLFTGWYTERTGGSRVYPDTMVNSTNDHTLYAHWEEAPTNNVIKNMVVKNNPDDNKDGVVDDIYLEFTCTSTFEKYNIPIKNLVKGQTYKLTYTASNDASFGDYITGYQNSVYGSYILATSALTGGRIENNYTENEYVAQVLANWSSRVEPDSTNDGSQKATNDSLLQGPWKNREIIFTAKETTMYWTWDFGLMEDNIQNHYNITNIVLEPIAPVIEFTNKQVIKGGNSAAIIASQENSAYSSNFTFNGDGGCETVYYPITGLTSGSTYTITFDHEFSGPLIHDTKSHNNPTYEYGCGIMNEKPEKTGDKMSALGSWASATFVKKTVDGITDSVTLKFTATGNTAYWVWNMANCSDNNTTTTKVRITKFSATHSGSGNITYYTDASNAATAITLDLLPEESKEVDNIQFIWDGIDDTNMEVWYPVDEQYPTAGDSYELAFEPLEGCTMMEVITVVIDDATYEVYTNGQIVEGTAAPIYDSESNILTIPAELLTTDTNTVSIIASAVPVEISITTESEEEEEQGEITVELNLTNVTAQGETALPAGNDYSFVLVPDEGYELPEIIRVDIDGTLYEVYTDGQEHRTLMEGEEELPPMPVFDPVNGTLTVPAALLSETAESMTITISAVEVVVDSKETKEVEEESQGNNQELDDDKTSEDTNTGSDTPDVGNEESEGSGEEVAE